MNEKQIDEIRARCEAATLGPWTYVDNGFDGYIMDGDGKFLIGGEPWEGRLEDDADTDFIAHAREDIPRLLAEVERLTQERDAAVKDITAMFEIDISTEICNLCKHNGKCSRDKSCDEQAAWRGPQEG